MAFIVYPNTFVASTPANASEVNANFNAISEQVNGNLEAANLADNAVTTFKILNAAVTAAKLADGSVIAGKLGPSSVEVENFAAIPVNTQAGTTYTLLASDKFGIVRMTHADANTVTIPENVFEIGDAVVILQDGAGQTSIVGAGGVTVESSGIEDRIVSRYASVTVTQITLNAWRIFGAVE